MSGGGDWELRDFATGSRAAQLGRSSRAVTFLLVLLVTVTGLGLFWASRATIEEIASALGWAGHTVRGAMAGALKKKLGLEVVSEKIEGRGRAYKLPAA